MVLIIRKWFGSFMGRRFGVLSKSLIIQIHQACALLSFTQAPVWCVYFQRSLARATSINNTIGKQKRFRIHRVAARRNWDLFTSINSQGKCFITAISKRAPNAYGDYVCRRFLIGSRTNTSRVLCFGFFVFFLCFLCRLDGADISDGI